MAQFLGEVFYFHINLAEFGRGIVELLVSNSKLIVFRFCLIKLDFFLSNCASQIRDTTAKLIRVALFFG